MDNEEQEEKHEAETEVLDFTQPDYTFVPKETHTWIQRGYYLTCHGCDLEHGVYIGSEKLLIGLAGDGSPILKRRDELTV